MTKYMVKVTATATADNPNFAGEVAIYYFGKGEEMIKREGTHLPKDNFDRTGYMLAICGYNRKCDAKRSYHYKHQEEGRYWTTDKVEIVEATC